MALQEMKFGMAGSPGSRERDSQGDHSVLMIPPKSEGNGNADMELAVNMPTGQPGTDKDEGTTHDPFGEKSDLQEKRGPEAQLTGVLGEGESLNDLIPAAGDTSKSTQRYRDLYNAIAAASKDSVEQEAIPIGSRFFVKRYFQNIRPEE